MPEIAEIKIMSDHINNRCSGKIFNVVWKNPQHKSKTDLTEISKVLLEGAQISSFSRGKELEVRFESEHNKISLFFMMGMSGNFKFITDQEAPPKHTHLIFKGENFALCMYDLRRFARWRIDTNWSDKRGPCQILGRIDSDPQVPALKYIEKNPEVLRMCYEISKQAYEIGGGRLKDWFNNEEIEDSSNNFKNWMRYYSNSEVCSPIVDGTGRKFWLNKKWIS